MTSQLVSVIVTNHNYGRYLSTAINSALDQTYQPIEVVVVDDGSTDGSRDVIAGFGRRVVSVLQDRGGQGAAYNAGFRASRGDPVCLLDADDAFLPTKVERVTDALRRFPAAAWLRHKLALTDEFLAPYGLTIPRFVGSSLTTVHPQVLLEHKVRFAVSSGIVLRRRTALIVLPIPELEVSLWQLGADAYVGTLSAGAGPCYSLDETLAYYRRHRHMTSSEATSRLLELNIRFERQLSAVWSRRLGKNVTATDIFKHTLVLESLHGEPLLSPQRWHTFLAGLAALPRIVPYAPTLAVRQAISLASAFLAPRLWTRRLASGLGFGVTPGDRRSSSSRTTDR